VRVSSNFSERTLESVPVRPEVAAFRELETLVRNLGEQLAGYRKRALSAESKSRELEETLAQVRAERDKAAMALRVSERSLKDAETRLAAMPAPFISRSSANEPPEEFDDPRMTALSRENRELHERLEQARERTTLVIDRVRFLRQQMTVEK
jgi:hypothetical protein